MIVILVIAFSTVFLCYSQDFNQENKDLANFIRRMYIDAPFEGVKVFTDYDNTYLLSVVSLSSDKYQNSSVMNRVASVKASSQASRFFNGSTITSECIIRTVENANNEVETTIEEIINENSIGYIKMLELLTSFELDSSSVFIYGKKIDIPTKEKKRRKR